MGEITLRRLCEKDLVWFHSVRNAPETRKWLHSQRHFSLSETVVWFREQNPFFWVALLDGVSFGYFRTDKVDYSQGSIEIGMDIATEFRGKGLAALAYKEFIALLEAKGFSTFTLEVFEHNVRAIHIYEKLGFAFQSRRPHYIAGLGTLQSVRMKFTLDKSCH